MFKSIKFQWFAISITFFSMLVIGYIQFTTSVPNESSVEFIPTLTFELYEGEELVWVTAKLPSRYNDVIIGGGYPVVIREYTKSNGDIETGLTMPLSFMKVKN